MASLAAVLLSSLQPLGLAGHRYVVMLDYCELEPTYSLSSNGGAGKAKSWVANSGGHTTTCS